MLDKLIAIGHLTLIARDGVVTLSLRGETLTFDVTADSVAAVIDAARLAMRDDVSAKIVELQDQIVRLRATL